ncbi:MAG: glycosyltransferase family 9 protein [Rhodospirillales bacterium]|jgi:ADP-heptose:LPS heptosyltransferase|nr:glycosyltransferase family 9 protein [Rhodospirillales bacterium]
MRILFISSTRVGDAILSTGLLDHLIRGNPGASVTIACGPAAAPLFEAVPGLERIIVLDKMVFSLHWLMLWALCGWHIWDIMVDLRNSSMYFLLPARERHKLARSPQPEHRVKQLARTLDLADNPPNPRLWLADRHMEEARRLIPDGPPVLAVGPTANWPAKTWRLEYFIELIERLTRPDGILPQGRVAVFARDDQRPMALRLTDAIPKEKCIDMMGRADLLIALACLNRSAFFVGNDSGLMHLAAAAGVPTLGLFGPSPETHYAPWGPLCAVARGSVPYDEIFPADFDHLDSGTLMDSLSVGAAEEAARNLWRLARERAA